MCYSQLWCLCCLQVGASNELPESEELDALYDRFLVRREVSQVRYPICSRTRSSPRSPASTSGWVY